MPAHSETIRPNDTVRLKTGSEPMPVLVFGVRRHSVWCEVKENGLTVGREFSLADVIKVDPANLDFVFTSVRRFSNDET